MKLEQHLLKTVPTKLNIILFMKLIAYYKLYNQVLQKLCRKLPPDIHHDRYNKLV